MTDDLARLSERLGDLRSRTDQALRSRSGWRSELENWENEFRNVRECIDVDCDNLQVKLTAECEDFTKLIHEQAMILREIAEVNTELTERMHEQTRLLEEKNKLRDQNIEIKNRVAAARQSYLSHKSEIERLGAELLRYRLMDKGYSILFGRLTSAVKPCLEELDGREDNDLEDHEFYVNCDGEFEKIKLEPGLIDENWSILMQHSGLEPTVRSAVQKLAPSTVIPPCPSAPRAQPPPVSRHRKSLML